MKTAVCTSKNAKTAAVELAKQYAQELGLAYITDSALAQAEYDCLLVVENSKLKLFSRGQSFFFHPSMSKLRIEAIKNGQHDNMVAAMQLTAGMSVLDTTLGLGSDSIVCSYIVGELGKTVALEAAQLLAFVVRRGLAEHTDKDADMMAACKRIEVHHCYALDYLSQQPTGSFDIVYIDPMFTKGINTSCNMSALRAFSIADNISAATLEQAKRVAKQRVVIKQPYYSALLKELSFTRLCGGRYSRIKYAVIDIDRGI